MSYRYLGNKSRLSNWIVGRIVEAVPAGATVADPMCGTATISAELARSGFTVIASDALTFPVVHARARLLAKTPPKFKTLGGYAAALEWMSKMPPVEGYFFREFGAEGSPANGRPPRKYFSPRNAAHIDGLRIAIRELAACGDLNEVEHSVLLHHLMLATNKVANITGTYGYFQSTLSASSQKPLEFQPIEFDWTVGEHSVRQGRVEDIAPTLSATAVYLDPPYTKRQYAGNYHILETIALEDEPPAVGDGGLRPWQEQASDFCYRRRAAQAFRETMKRLDVEDVFISYSEDGQVAADELSAILADFGNVRVYEQPHVRFRSNARTRKDTVVERLYHVKAY